MRAFRQVGRPAAHNGLLTRFDSGSAYHLLISDSATAAFLLLVSIAIVALAVAGMSELCAAPKVYYPQPTDTVPALKAPQE